MIRKLTVPILLTLLFLSGCGQSAAPSTDTELRPVTLGMGFIANVQFAPFYVAAEKGYFEEEGIEVTFDYGMENDLLQLVAADEMQFAIASGDQVLVARAQELPVVYVANVFRQFPVAITSISEDLSDLSVLEGKTVGLPGLFGANYIGWLALANAAGLNQSAIALEPIGFNQVPVLIDGQVDAAMVYATNEPIQLADAGYDPSVVMVSTYVDLVSNGLVTNEQTIADHPDWVEGMTRAILRGVADTLADPDGAFAITTSARWVPEAGGNNAAAQRKVFDASLLVWQNEKLGQLPISAWEASQQVLLDAGIIDQALSLDDAATNTFAEQALADQ